MNIKNIFSFAIILILFMSILFPSKSLATSWAYPFVVWDGFIYVISEEYVSEIDSEIGHVTQYSDMESYSGNFSNIYKKGTKYYSIEGISTDEAIAVQDKDGKYKKAIRGAEYTGGKTDFSGLQSGFVVLILIAIFAIYFVKKRFRK